MWAEFKWRGRAIQVRRWILSGRAAALVIISFDG